MHAGSKEKARRKKEKKRAYKTEKQVVVACNRHKHERSCTLHAYMKPCASEILNVLPTFLSNFHVQNNGFDFKGTFETQV